MTASILIDSIHFLESAGRILRCSYSLGMTYLPVGPRHNESLPVSDVTLTCLRRIRSAVSITPGRFPSRVVQNRVPRQPEETRGSGQVGKTRAQYPTLS